jgi:membrane-anchored glycerophosphoryl diester phosphodiesterase (GDPDase)
MESRLGSEVAMGAWERSWLIARKTFALMGQDKEMLWFPILAGIFSLLFSAALLVPTFVLSIADQAGGPATVVGPLQVIVLFVTYFGLSFIATFFNVCVVYTTRVRLSGGDATFMDSIKFAISRAHLIAAWSLLSASVGLLLRGIESLAERAGLVGKILLSILRVVLATAWSIMTIFVVPAMVYRDVGPIEAIRESVGTLRRTWGENLVRYFGIGLASFVCALPFVLLLFGGFALLSSAPPIGFVLFAFGVLGLTGVSIVFGVANTVFNTVLYHWASDGSVAEGFEPELLSGAFKLRTA